MLLTKNSSARALMAVALLLVCGTSSAQMPSIPRSVLKKKKKAVAPPASAPAPEDTFIQPIIDTADAGGGGSSSSGNSATLLADSSAKSADSSAKSADSSAKSADSSAKSADSSAKSADSSAKSADSSAKSADSSAKSADSAVKPAELQQLDIEARLFILGGRVDIENRYPFTVMVSTDDLSMANRGQCSGVLIEPRVVLTAGHCVCKLRQVTTPGNEDKTTIDSSDCAKTADVTVFFYDEAQRKKKNTVKIKTTDVYEGEVRAHPDLKIVLDNQERVLSSQSDLALVVLDEPVRSGIQLAGLANAEPQLDEAVTLVGYGYDKVYGGMFGIRRSGKNKVTKAASSTGERILVENPGSHIYKGDSGGPCVRETPNGFGVIGIASIGTGLSSTFTSVYYHRDWVRSESQRMIAAGSSAAKGEGTPAAKEEGPTAGNSPQ